MKRYRIGLIHHFSVPNAYKVDGLRASLGGFGIDRISPHITLVPPANLYLKDVGDEIYRLRKIAAETAPYEFEVGPAGTFYPVSPVLYLSVGGTGLAEMASLQARLVSSELYKPNTRPYVPHVTLMDPADSADIAAALKIIKSVLFSQSVDSFEMMISHAQAYWELYSDFRFESPRRVHQAGMSLEVFTHSSGDLAIYKMVAEHGISPSLFWPCDDVRFRCGGQEHTVVSIYNQGQLVACGSANHHSAVGLLRAVVVQKDLRRLGIGSLVVRELLYRLELAHVEASYVVAPVILESFFQNCGSRPANAYGWLIDHANGMTLNSWSFSRR
ncbi:MAG: hypothetical protein EPN30_08540 [Actinomycetota bacterium]|nr:MAG: hypothetical protein EPN30_08540 [Actinomycetota bacterium]